jgi:ABC-type antimicrobial peptide transport system permease subunit
LFGIYGIVSCYVADRTREIGLRSALGATEGQLVRFVMGRGLRLAIRGGIAGLALAIAAAWGLRGMLYGVAAGDPVTYVVVVALVVAVAVGAGLLPARRAARVNPVVALRA